MKPDDFSDQIRRKLESVEPEFREKDWTQMQQALGHSTPVFAFGTKAGLMAAASLAAVMTFGGVAYHHYQANKHLRDQVQTLHQTVASLRQGANVAQPNPVLIPPDTVFLTRDVVRYVAVPVDRKRTDEIAETNSPSSPYITETPSTVNNSPAPGITASSRNRSSVSPNGLPGSPESRPTVSQNRTRTSPNSPADLAINGTVAGVNNPRVSGNNGANNDGAGAQNSDVASGTMGTTSSFPAAGNAETNSHNAVQLSLLSSRPFSRDTVYYQEGMARTARRMRRLPSVTSPQGTALAKVDVNRSEPVWKARIGSGANVGWQQWGAGLFGEIRLNSHWRLGVGLTSVNLKGESFLTETDYDRRTRQDFRRNFAPGIDSRHDIINITPTGSSWQVPVMLSYRIGLGSGWSLIPSAGLNLSLSNREEIGFAYLRGPGKIEPVTIVRKSSQQMLHAGSAAIYLEKNWGDWALQIGPYGSTPLSTTPSRLNNKTAGAAARLYYQIDWKKKR